MVSEKLLPCPTPWCDDEEKYVWQGPDDRFHIICGCCQVEGPAADDQQDAIAAWNTRAPADLRSALEAETDEFATVEEWEHDDQRELSLLYNHRADDSLQFNRSQMRTAIRHGKSLAALAPTKGDVS